MSSMPDFVAWPSRWRTALLVLGSLGFVSVGLWIIGAFGPPPHSSRYSPGAQFLWGWFAICFFGLCAAAGVKQLLGTGERLRIGSAGLCWPSWSLETIPWSEICGVTTWTYRGQTMIVLHLRDPEKYPPRKLRWLRGVNRVFTGGDIAISLTGSDRDWREALEAIRRFRECTAH